MYRRGSDSLLAHSFIFPKTYPISFPKYFLNCIRCFYYYLSLPYPLLRLFYFNSAIIFIILIYLSTLYDPDTSSMNFL